MLKELFDAICHRAIEGTKAQITELSLGDAFNAHYLRNGEHFTIPKPVSARSSVVETVVDLIEAVEQWGQKGGVLWHDRKQVVLIVNDADRRERVTLPLVLSEHFKLISNLPPAMNQKQFVKLLRHDLAGRVPDTLRPAISAIEVATSSGQKNEINPGRERGSREFACDITNGDAIPETFFAVASVYANAGLRQDRSIKLSLDYTLPPAEITFSVRPLPDEIEIAIQDAQAELHERLAKAVKIPVFSGTP